MNSRNISSHSGTCPVITPLRRLLSRRLALAAFMLAAALETPATASLPIEPARLTAATLSSTPLSTALPMPLGTAAGRLLGQPPSRPNDPPIMSRQARIFLISISTIILLVLGGVIAWSNSLRRLVDVRTAELSEAKRSLEEYSRTLEQRVAERTHDLQQKNAELAETLQQVQEMQQQVIMSERMASLGNLVAGVAHEVNTPIGAVNSAADVSRRSIERLKSAIDGASSVDELKNSASTEKLLNILLQNNGVIVSAGKRVAEIVRSLKNFSRLDEAEHKKANIHEGIESTLTLVQHELKNKVDVVRNYGDIPEIKCFPNQLNQVFMNLFINAAHAIDERGTITITTTANAKNVQITIADTGKGIQPEHLDKIFEPGFTTKGVGVGTGLGLSICYKIIEKHNGSISVTSEIGQGTTFTIKLPIG